MSSVHLELWDGSDNEKLFEMDFELPFIDDMRVSTHSGSAVHTLFPDRTNLVKVVLPPTSTVGVMK